MWYRIIKRVAGYQWRVYRIEKGLEQIHHMSQFFHTQEAANEDCKEFCKEQRIFANFSH